MGSRALDGANGMNVGWWRARVGDNGMGSEFPVHWRNALDQLCVMPFVERVVVDEIGEMHVL